jgi:hypothetical protein
MDKENGGTLTAPNPEAAQRCIPMLADLKIIASKLM